MPDAGRVRCAAPTGGALLGGAPRAVWLTTESNPCTLSARAVAQWLVDNRRSSHLVWNPVSGETVQILPASAPAKGQLTTGGTDRALEGRVCIVIRVIGHAFAPFTDTPLTGLSPILGWLDSWGIPRRRPAGPPSAPPVARPVSADDRLWARGGHFGHSQVPGACSSAPGAISWDRLLGSTPSGIRPVPLGPPPVLPAPGLEEHNERTYAEVAGN